MPMTVNSPSTTIAIININGKPASPAPPKQPHSPVALAQLSKQVVQSVHIQRVPGKWQSAQTLQDDMFKSQSLSPIIRFGSDWF